MAQTQAQQITKIVEDLTALHKEHGEAIDAMRKQVGRLEERMETYEDQTKENTAILKENTTIIKEVQHAVTGFYSTLEKIGRSVRYILITVASIAAGIVVIVVANWLLVLWHIHP